MFFNDVVRPIADKVEKVICEASGRGIFLLRRIPTHAGARIINIHAGAGIINIHAGAGISTWGGGYPCPGIHCARL